jgi:YHS domain-containing protein
MKKLALLAALALLPFAAPAARAEEGHDHHAQKSAVAGLKKVETKYVCMINNQVFDKEQIAVEVDGKTYYGCCAMCKERLAKDAESRKAVDPVSMKEVDKAKAVIGADAEGNVHYFENEENLKAFDPKKG